MGHISHTFLGPYLKSPVLVRTEAHSVLGACSILGAMLSPLQTAPLLCSLRMGAVLTKWAMWKRRLREVE